MTNLTKLGRVFVAVAMIAFGVQHFVYQNFVTRVFPKLPAWIPAHSMFAAVFGAFLIIAGLAILFSVEARLMALLLGVVILVSFVVLYGPLLFANPLSAGVWTNAGKALALAGGNFLVAGSFPAGSASGWRGTIANALARLIPLGRCFLAAFLIFAGAMHFIYTQFAASLIPLWIPGHMFWTYFAGCALIAGGVGIILPRTTRLAALLTGIMIFLWVLLLHIPRALASPHNFNETTAVFEALAMSGAAFLIAAKPRR
jgi:uncharacterized membrane protein